MRIPFLFFAFLSLYFVIAPPLSLATDAAQDETKANPLAQRYEEAKFYFNQLETNSSLGNSRDNWLKGVRSFRKIYLSSPKSEFAPASLFMLGRMYDLMYKRFSTKIDLGESISYYRDVTNLFPQHYLADDALYNVGQLQLNDSQDPHKAAKSFRKVVSEYQEGDFYVRASEKLKVLSKEYDIPLPNTMVSQSQLTNLSTVLPVKYWSSKDYTRVVINASGPVTYREQLLEKMDDKPRRLYIDFTHSYIEPRYRSPVPIEDGLLKQIRTGQFTPDTVRVVLDIESISSYKIFSLPDPFRVVIDVRGQVKSVPITGEQPTVIAQSTSEPTIAQKQPEPFSYQHPADKAVDESATRVGVSNSSATQVVVLDDRKKTRVNGNGHKFSPTEVPAPSIAPLSLAQQLGLGVKRIVLDPGHGGKDPGATANGMKEKDIVLSVAKKLVPILENKLGCEVVLTRDKDIYIPLEERTAIANTSDGDLFISLHINAHPSLKVKGMETYFLNLSTNSDAMRVAARENATSTHQMSDLQDILSDIMKNSKINESSRLAQFVHNALHQGLQNSTSDTIKSLGVKQAPFYVLIGAEMPAILIEIAFISNPEDAERLRSDAFLNSVSQEIVTGIRSYIQSTTASL